MEHGENITGKKQNKIFNIKLIMRNICLISDGRTSHGIYKPVLDQISKSKKLNYKYILTGFHFDKNYGNTYKEIISEGYTISHKIVIKKKL